jgi:hypothetical protein
MSKNFEIIYKEFMNSETFVVSRELLEDYKRQAAQDERERIIKQLEERIGKCEEFIEQGTDLCTCEIVAFIKGQSE